MMIEQPVMIHRAEGGGAIRAKQRKRWSEEEHRKLLEGLRLYGRDWKRIQHHVGSRNAAQLRSHAQKYFVKVLREGTDEYIPPPQSRRTAISLELPLPLTRGPLASASQPTLALASSLVRQLNDEAKRHSASACAELGSPSAERDGWARPRVPLCQLGCEEVQAGSPLARRAQLASPRSEREPGAQCCAPPAPLPTSAADAFAAGSRAAGPPPAAGAPPDAGAAQHSPRRPGRGDGGAPAPGAARGEPPACVSQGYASVAQARAAILRLSGASQAANLRMLSLVADTIRGA